MFIGFHIHWIASSLLQYKKMCEWYNFLLCDTNYNPTVQNTETDNIYCKNLVIPNSIALLL